ncbi:MAG: hypothetical protein HZA50_05545 [Planctomycetes bacterium]|nr:hypothetical protein [Planctomycetota bacterium]
MTHCNTRFRLFLAILATSTVGCATSPESQARNELQEAKRLLEPPTDRSFGVLGEMDWQLKLPASVRLEILNHALRAAKLDPANEEANYLAAIHADAVWAPQEQLYPVACADLVLPACSLYVERFGSKVPDHYDNILYRQFNVAVAAFVKLHGWPNKDDILRPPDARAYPYASKYVRALAEFGYFGQINDRYHLGNAWEAFSYNLIGHVIPSCPDDKLDSEYAYWESFWRDYKNEIEHPKENPGPRTECATRPLPWGIIAAAFAARKKDAQGVRRGFQQAAMEIPKKDINVWGGDGFNQHFERLVPLYLKAAGDPDWETWLPEFPDESNIKSKMTGP